MRAALVAILGACHAVAQVGASAPPPDADIIAKSHAAIVAFDRGDVAAVTAMLGTRYVHFEGAYVDRDKELATVAHAHDDPAAGIAQRTWSDERVFARNGDAVFGGRATEHQAGNDI